MIAQERAAIPPFGVFLIKNFSSGFCDEKM